MNLSNETTRRDVLRLLSAAGLSALAGAPAIGLLSCASPKTPGDKLGSVFHSLDAAKAIGAAYLQEHPSESDPAHLVQLILDSSESVRGIDRLSLKDLRREISILHSSDLAQGRTTLVRGWTLSLTESRLCALAALT